MVLIYHIALSEEVTKEIARSGLKSRRRLAEEGRSSGDLPSSPGFEDQSEIVYFQWLSPDMENAVRENHSGVCMDVDPDRVFVHNQFLRGIDRREYEASRMTLAEFMRKCVRDKRLSIDYRNEVVLREQVVSPDKLSTFGGTK
jgi:hypothetical protein